MNRSPRPVRSAVVVSGSRAEGVVNAQLGRMAYANEQPMPGLIQ